MPCCTLPPTMFRSESSAPPMTVAAAPSTRIPSWPLPIEAVAGKFAPMRFP